MIRVALDVRAIEPSTRPDIVLDVQRAEGIDTYWIWLNADKLGRPRILRRGWRRGGDSPTEAA